MSFKGNGLSPVSSPHNKLSPTNRKKSPPNSNNDELNTSPIKYLLQNNVKLNIAKEGERTPQQIEVISHLLKQCTIFSDLQISLTDPAVCKELCNGIVLIYCQSPHIMQIKDNEIYVFFQGQGFEYMQNNFGSDISKKYHLYENNQYIMLRKINTNEYFLSIQENNARYHSNQKKYQLMVDENTLIGKFSEETFYKLFHSKILERQKNVIAVLKKVQIFNGLPSSFFQEFSKFVSEQKKLNGEKVLSRSSKSKFVYFVKSGSAEMHYFNQSTNKPPINGNQNYYLSNYRPYTLANINQFDSFGMEAPEMVDNDTEKEVICTNDCVFLKIDKRLLAIIITSFELQFQQKNKLWSEVNINNQIKGQNYITPQKQLLLKNVERIRTSERKIRDIKLRYLSSNKSKKEINPCALPNRQESFKQIIKQEIYEQKQENSKASSPVERRRMIKTAQGRFRSTSIIKFINNFGGLQEEKKYNAIRKKLDEERENQLSERVNRIEIVALDSEEGRASQKLRSTNPIDYKQRLEYQRSSRSTSKLERYQPLHKFIPKLQVKSSIISTTSKADSEMIGVFLDKKIKNEILKKAERVLHINRNVKITENKNLKRLFAPCTTRPVNAISEFDRKSIAEDIVEKMSNLRENPLLLQIESERRKLERQLKLSSRKRKLNDSPSPNKRYKKEDLAILIKEE